MKVKKLLLGMILLAFVLLLVRCAASHMFQKKEERDPSKAITVGFAATGHESDWRLSLTGSIQEEISEENGYGLKLVDCNQDYQTQLAAMETFIDQKVDYIVLDPVISVGWEEILDRCEEAEIPVIVIDRQIEDSKNYQTWIGSDLESEGAACGTWLASYVSEQEMEDVNILMIDGDQDLDADSARMDGFRSQAKKNHWKILGREYGGRTISGGKAVMEEFLNKYAGKFNVVVCFNDNEAFGAMDAMDEAEVTYGSEGDVILLSFEACKAGIECVDQEKINADFEQTPKLGTLIRTTIEELEAGEKPEKEQHVGESYFDTSMDLTEALKQRDY